jgi:hypothetical protein
LVEVRGWALRDPIPTLPIPLRPPDADVLIDLQSVYNQAFTRGGYPRRLRYNTIIEHVNEAIQTWCRAMASNAK